MLGDTYTSESQWNIECYFTEWWSHDYFTRSSTE